MKHLLACLLLAMTLHLLVGCAAKAPMIEGKWVVHRTEYTSDLTSLTIYPNGSLTRFHRAGEPVIDRYSEVDGKTTIHSDRFEVKSVTEEQLIVHDHQTDEDLVFNRVGERPKVQKQ